MISSLRSHANDALWVAVGFYAGAAIVIHFKGYAPTILVVLGIWRW